MKPIKRFTFKKYYVDSYSDKFPALPITESNFIIFNRSGGSPGIILVFKKGTMSVTNNITPVASSLFYILRDTIDTRLHITLTDYNFSCFNWIIRLFKPITRPLYKIYKLYEKLKR